MHISYDFLVSNFCLIPISCYFSLSIPPENIRKPLVWKEFDFSMFSRGYEKRPVTWNDLLLEFQRFLGYFHSNIYLIETTSHEFDQFQDWNLNIFNWKIIG